MHDLLISPINLFFSSLGECGAKKKTSYNTSSYYWMYPRAFFLVYKKCHQSVVHDLQSSVVMLPLKERYTLHFFRGGLKIPVSHWRKNE